MAVSALAVITLVLIVLTVVLAVASLALVPIARRAKRMEAELHDELGDDVRRMETVRGLGLRSAGRGQIRGTGTLVLTRDELSFRQMVPRRETRIPLATVTDVGT